MKRVGRHLYIGFFVFVFGVLGFGSIDAAFVMTDCVKTETDSCYKTYMADELDKQTNCILNVTKTCEDKAKAEKDKEAEKIVSDAVCAGICTSDMECYNKCTNCPAGQTYDKEFGCMLPEITVTPQDCNTCKENFCANEKVSCDKAKAEAACATECKSGSEGDGYVKGIKINPDCLKNGQCSFKIYDLLGIKQDIPAESRTSATFFVQDVLLAATFFIGTIVTVALIWSGVMYILAGASGKDPANAKKGITYSIIGLLLVVGSYSIIRLIQYIAKGL